MDDILAERHAEAVLDVADAQADTIARLKAENDTLKARVAELEGRAAVHGRRTRSMNSEIARLSLDAAGGAGEIAAERQRQKEVEGWTPEHDDQHTDGSLATVAACYIAPGYAKWPKSWSQDWWKPKDRRADLVRAGALIAAEIDRLDRLAVRGIEAAAEVIAAAEPVVGEDLKKALDLLRCLNRYADGHGLRGPATKELSRIKREVHEFASRFGKEGG